MLINKGADTSMVNSDGMNALHIAVQENLLNIVQKLVEDSRVDIDFQDRKLNTALHYASAENDVESCKILLRKNASPDIVNNEGETPLHIAARENCIEIVNTLLEFKKEKKTKSGTK